MLAQAFALAAPESQRLVDDLLADGGSRRFRVHLAGPDDAAALLSLQVAADVFLGAFGNTPDLLRAEYAPLFPAMTHVVVLDSVTRTAVGSLILQAARGRGAEDRRGRRAAAVVDAGRPHPRRRSACSAAPAPAPTCCCWPCARATGGSDSRSCSCTPAGWRRWSAASTTGRRSSTTRCSTA